LRQINTGSSIVARPGGTFININLAIFTSKTSWAVALGFVIDRYTQTSMHTQIIITLDLLAVILSGSSDSKSLFTGLALEALALTAQWLEVIQWARCTRGKASWGVISRGTPFPALVRISAAGLEGVHASWAGITFFVAINRWVQRVSVSRALQARN